MSLKFNLWTSHKDFFLPRSVHVGVNSLHEGNARTSTPIPVEVSHDGWLDLCTWNICTCYWKQSGNKDANLKRGLTQIPLVILQRPRWLIQTWFRGCSCSLMLVYPPQEHIVQLAVHIFDSGLIQLVKLNEESAVVQRYHKWVWQKVPCSILTYVPNGWLKCRLQQFALLHVSLSCEHMKAGGTWLLYGGKEEGRQCCPVHRRGERVMVGCCWPTLSDNWFLVCGSAWQDARRQEPNSAGCIPAGSRERAQPGRRVLLD